MTDFFHLAAQYLPQLFQAALTYTLPLALISFSLALVFAVLTAMIRLAKRPDTRIGRIILGGLKGIAFFYVWLFRATPMIVQLFIVFYGLPNAHINFFSNAWVSAITVFSLNTGAYASESVRAAILSVPHVQVEAAESLGMRPRQVYVNVILPQAARISIPPLSNALIGLLKDTALASVITIVEMFYLSQQIAAENYKILTMYLLAAFVYAVLTTALSLAQHQLERYTSRFAQ